MAKLKVARPAILLVIDSLNLGGAQNQLILVAQQLSQHGYSVDIFTYHDLNYLQFKLPEDNVRVHLSARKGVFGISSLLALRSLIAHERYQSIVSFMNSPNLLTTLAKFLAFSATPHFVTYRSQTVFKNLSLLKRLSRIWVNQRAVGIIANSNHERLAWQAFFPRHANKWSTIYNGVIDKGHVTKRKRHKQLLVVGSVSYLKNGTCLVAALNLLKKTEKLNYTVQWVGRRDSGIPGHENCADELDEQLDVSYLQDHWVWEGQQKDVQPFYLAADALVHMSQKEGLPNVVCEAQMAGCPVIISDILDHPTLIKEAHNGYRFNPDSPEELATKIQTLYDLSDEQYENLCSNSRKSAETNFSVEKFINEYIKLIEQA